jgi:hypothetical protein
MAALKGILTLETSIFLIAFYLTQQFKSVERCKSIFFNSIFSFRRPLGSAAKGGPITMPRTLRHAPGANH